MHISLASYVIQIVHPPLKTLDLPLSTVTCVAALD